MIDTAFFQAFVLTFRSFTSGDELMDLLLERYNIQPPPGLNAGEMIDWTKQKQTPIRLRYVFSSSSSSFHFFLLLPSISWRLSLLGSLLAYLQGYQYDSKST
jgi:son of sevenless-like protein